jgi:hemerythrin-like domain-containing protein
MTVTAILSGVFAFIKAVPLFYSWFQQIVDMYIQAQVDEIHDTNMTIKQEEIALYELLKKAKTPIERGAIAKSLYRLHKL